MWKLQKTSENIPGLRCCHFSVTRTDRDANHRLWLRAQLQRPKHEEFLVRCLLRGVDISPCHKPKKPIYTRRDATASSVDCIPILIAGPYRTMRLKVPNACAHSRTARTISLFALMGKMKSDGMQHANDTRSSASFSCEVVGLLLHSVGLRVLGGIGAGSSPLLWSFCKRVRRCAKYKSMRHVFLPFPQCVPSMNLTQAIRNLMRPVIQ